jgi:Na+/proline symporter
MTLHPIDLAVVVGWIAITLILGAVFARRATASSDAFFVAGRSLPWWVVGTSMVATTFAADTPLVVSGLAAKGLHANWFWWVFGLQGMTAVFLFARLWRRSGVVTDAELVELRYGGRAGSAVRGAKALWFGVFFNVLVIAWVMRAMAKITTVLFALEGARWGPLAADTWIVLALFVATAAYTQAAGLYGVVATDVAQFGVAIAAAILLAVLTWAHLGGLPGLEAGLAAHALDLSTLSRLVPEVGGAADGAFAGFVVLLGVVWWGQHNIDGGGYIAQRLLAARDERHATWAYVWFTVAHLCLRPWPWLIVGLGGLAVFGPVEDPETLYPRMMRLLLPTGAFGLMLASFLAAFMSTIDTQLHWGASLVVNDGWRRFVRPAATEREVVRVSRVAIVGLAALGAVVSFAIDDIAAAWKLAISVTAGLGTVYLGRWLWWRVTAWCELSAMLVAGLATAAFALLAPRAAELGLPAGWLAFPFSTAATALLSVAVWVPVALWTSRGADRAHLRRFYDRVRPPGPGWRAIAPDAPGRFPAHVALGWVGGVAAVYGALFLVGHLLFARPGLAAIDGAVAVGGAALCAWAVRREDRASA